MIPTAPIRGDFVCRAGRIQLKIEAAERFKGKHVIFEGAEKVSAHARRLVQPNETHEVRLRYNSLFFPEFLSIILIALAVSWIALSNPGKAAKPLEQNPHSVPAFIGYMLVVVLLLYFMLQHRRSYQTARLIDDGEGNVSLCTRDLSLPLETVDRIDECVGRFFGRKARYLRIARASGDVVEFNDALYQYEELKVALTRLCTVDIRRDPAHSEGQYDKIRTAWARRHRVFSPNYAWWPLNIASRLFCLVPVAFFDVMVTALMCMHLDVANQPDLAVYVSAISLLLSAILSRYVYYYLFTSELLHRQRGQ
ncbi:MAG: hypothetical protein WD648_12915 [Planctomycetaceae bacterium]